MTPERAARLVARWVRFYTRRLPAPVAERRAGEIEADVHDHIAHERASGTSDRRIALGVTARMVRGMGADVSWRGKHSPGTRAVIRVALVTGLVLLVPLVGAMAWSPFDFALAAVLVAGTGLVLELAVRRVNSRGYRFAAAAIAIAAMVAGEADDAPGLVLFGILVIVGTVALTFRADAAA